MKEIIEWLIGIEKMAGTLYRNAELFFKDDEGLSAFLGELAEDEAWHFHIMGSAAQFIRDHPETTPAQIVLDETTRSKVETPFTENLRQLATGDISKNSILTSIVGTEFSEWNDLFLYVVNSLKEESREFQYVAARMQGHLKHIMDFLQSRPEGDSLLEEFRTLTPVWRDRILIVEDSDALLGMLERVFRRDYITASAKNGREALEKLQENYFDVILSDIDMPEMNGIDFFQAAIGHDPDLAGRFLFFSGFLSDAHREVIDAYHVPFLQKPASVVDLREKIARMLEGNRQTSMASAS